MVNDAALRVCYDDLVSNGIIPNDIENLRTIIDSNVGFVDVLNEYYGASSGGGYLTLDTQDRDELFDVIANHFVGRSWPINKDPDPNFAADLIAATNKVGWSNTFES